MSLVLIRAVFWTAALCVLAAASVIDLRRRIIPNEASAFIAANGVLLGLLSRPGTVWIGLSAAAALFVMLAFASRLTLIGGGDVKLIAAVSLLVPPQGIAGLLLAIALAGGVLSLAYLGLRRVLGAGHAPSQAHPTGGFLHGERGRILASRTVPYSLAVFAGVVAYVLSELPQCSSETHCLL